MKSLQRMVRFLRPYRWVVIIGLLTVILPVLMELTVPRMPSSTLSIEVSAQVA